MSNQSNKKVTASLMILIILAGCIFSGLLTPARQAQAAYPIATLPMQIKQWIMDKIWEAKDLAIQQLQKLYSQITANIQQWFKYDTLYQRALKDAWNVMRAQLLKQLSEDILKWAQGENGDTNFVKDWGSYLGKKTEEAGQKFVDESLGTGVSCPDNTGKSFDKTIQEIYKNESNNNFQEQIKCPYDAQSFYNDFENGGWDAFTYSLLPGGNFLGTLLLTDDNLMYTMGQEYEAQKDKLVANQGFKGNEKTPGIVQSYATQRASMMDLDYLLNSPDLNTYVSSIVDSFINRIISEGLSEMKMEFSGDDKYVPKGEPPVVTLPPIVEDINYIKDNYELLSGIDEEVKLIQENLNEMRKEQDLNLPLMIEIKSLQDKCGIKTDDIGPELADLYDEIDQATASIALASNTIDDLVLLMAAADKAIDADKKGETETASSTVAEFKTILKRIVNEDSTGSLQVLLGTKIKALDLLYIEASGFALEVAEDTANYVARRGDKKAAKEMPETLYGQLKLERKGCS